MKSFQKLQKRHVLLLEVLIAFTLMVLCVLPLFYPLTYLLREQNGFINKIELDHEVNLAYANLMTRLYANDISWDELNDSGQHEIKLGKDLPYKGYYVFGEIKHKPEEEQSRMVFLKTLDFIFTSTDKKEFKYHYNICVVRDIK